MLITAVEPIFTLFLKPKLELTAACPGKIIVSAADNRDVWNLPTEGEHHHIHKRHLYKN